MPDTDAVAAITVRLETARHAISAEVRAELARQNKTLRDVAEYLGMAHSSLHARVRGEVSFRADELVVLADALGVPVVRLLGLSAMSAS